MSILFSLSLFFLSFMPLWLSVLFIDIKSICENNANLYTEYISIGCIMILVFVAIIILAIELCGNKKDNTQKLYIKSVYEEKTITAEFLLSYILPLFTFDFKRWDDVVLFFVFFFTFAFLCIKHNYFSVNIILEICGYQFYRCILVNEDKVEIEKIVISHSRLNTYIGDTVYVKSLNNEYKLLVEQ